MLGFTYTRGVCPATFVALYAVPHPHKEQHWLMCGCDVLGVSEELVGEAAQLQAKFESLTDQVTPFFIAQTQPWIGSVAHPDWTREPSRVRGHRIGDQLKGRLLRLGIEDVVGGEYVWTAANQLARTLRERLESSEGRLGMAQRFNDLTLLSYKYVTETRAL
ncbi:hypothetical protein [Deinococcus alpinitundrae]|uniref:hypothetical protein n=1 Tax=Deinococcus alpinitundrae TaxID=468913 RepID=UPI00137B0C65|nr:hypothetical protein [Deinococcus alpinitundrae]